MRRITDHLSFDPADRTIYNEIGQQVSPLTFENATSTLFWGLWSSPIDPIAHATLDTASYMARLLTKYLPPILTFAVVSQSGSTWYGTSRNVPERQIQVFSPARPEQKYGPTYFNAGRLAFSFIRTAYDHTIGVRGGAMPDRQSAELKSAKYMGLARAINSFYAELLTNKVIPNNVGLTAAADGESLMKFFQMVQSDPPSPFLIY